MTRGDLTEGEMPWRGPRARQHSLLQATPALLLHRGGFHTEYCSPGQEKWGRPGVCDPSGRLVLVHRNSSVTKLRLSCCSVSGLTWIFLPSSLQESSLLHFLGSQLVLTTAPEVSPSVLSPCALTSTRSALFTLRMVLRSPAPAPWQVPHPSPGCL